MNAGGTSRAVDHNHNHHRSNPMRYNVMQRDHDILYVKVPSLLRATIERLATADERAMTNMARRLIQEALAARGELRRDDTIA